jgi:hypothetical protein
MLALAFIVLDLVTRAGRSRALASLGHDGFFIHGSGFGGGREHGFGHDG